MATWTLIGARSVSASQVATESAPTGDVGMNLDSVAAIVPVMRAPDGHTFTGAGHIRGYLRLGGEWHRAPRADDDLLDLAGLSSAALQGLPVSVPAGQFAIICEGVGVSGGTNITLELWAVDRRGMTL